MTTEPRTISFTVRIPRFPKFSALHVPARQVIGRALILLAILLLCISGYNFRWILGQLFAVPETGILFMFLGGITLGIGVWLTRPTLEQMRVTKNPPAPYRVKIAPTILGIVAMLAFSEINRLAFFSPSEVSQHVQALLFISGALLTAYGLGAFVDFKPANWFAPHYLLLYMIIVVALILRLSGLAADVHFMIDEMHFFDGIRDLWNEPNLPLLRPMNGIAMFPYFYSYMEQFTLEIFGGDFYGVRMMNPIFGALTVLGVYLLGTAMTDKKTGLLAAAFLAIFPPHIHFSKLASSAIADPFFGVMTFAFLITALKTNRTRDYVLAGLFWGLTAYWYEGGRLVFLGITIIWVGMVIVWHRPRQHWRGLVLMGIMALVVFFPYYYATPVYTGGGLTPRLSQQGHFFYFLRDLQEQPVLDVLKLHWDRALSFTLAHVVYSPDSSRFYYGGEVGILHWYVVPFAFLGLFYSIYKLRSLSLMILVWLGASLVGISFTVPTDWTIRYCVIFPVLALLVAIGIRYPLDALGLKPRLKTVLTLGILAALTYFQLQFYYTFHLPLYNQQARADRYDFYDAWDRASEINGVYKLIYASDTGMFDPVIWSMRDIKRVTMDYEHWYPSEGIADELATLDLNQVYVFAIAPGDVETWAQINAVAPLSPALPWSSYASVPLDRQYALYLYQPPGVAPRR